MKNKLTLPIVFIVTSGLIFMLGSYLFVTKATLHPRLFITACGEVLKNVQDHIHFNPDGVVSSLILLATAVSSSLVFLQVVKFIVSHRKLNQFQKEEVPDILKVLLRKHNVPSHAVLVVATTHLTAYTTGICKPRITISKALLAQLSQEQLEAVLLHELYHYRSRHLLWLLLSRLVSSFFFFIPLVEYLAHQLRTEFELAADAFVVEKQKTSAHLRSSLAFQLQYVDGVIPHFATSPIEKRVESLAGNKIFLEKIGSKQLIVSLLSLGLMIGIAGMQPRQAMAGFTVDSALVCSVGEECRTTDCSDTLDSSSNFTPSASGVNLFSSSH